MKNFSKDEYTEPHLRSFPFYGLRSHRSTVVHRFYLRRKLRIHEEFSLCLAFLLQFRITLVFKPYRHFSRQNVPSYYNITQGSLFTGPFHNLLLWRRRPRSHINYIIPFVLSCQGGGDSRRVCCKYTFGPTILITKNTCTQKLIFHYQQIFLVNTNKIDENPKV